MGAPSMGAPGTVCIPESAKDQARKFGYKCMTPERIAIFNVRLEKSCREGIIKGHGKFRRGENDKRASKNTNINMMEEVMERTSHCLEKKSVQQCQERVLSGLHIDDDFCFPIAERWCGATEDIRIKTDGTEIPYGVGVKFAADLCAHYKIIPTQAAALEKIGGGLSKTGGLYQQIIGAEELGPVFSNNLKAGDITVFSDMTAHSSGPNVSPHRRSSIILRYVPVDVRAFDLGRPGDFKGWNANSILVSGTDPSGHWAQHPRPLHDDFALAVAADAATAEASAAKL